MLRQPITICIILLIWLSPIDGARTYIVDNHGFANYKTIGDAVDRSNNGDTIYIKSGVYKEEILLNKTLTVKPLMGEKGPFILEGAGKDTGIKITADGCSIDGLTIQNFTKSGIEVSSNKNIIKNNKFSNDDPAVLVRFSSQNTISGNSMKDCSHGMVVWSKSSNNKIEDNDISGGIYSIFLADVNKNSISKNKASSNGTILGLNNCTDITLSSNSLTGGQTGIEVSNCSKISISDSSIKGASYSMALINLTSSEIDNNSMRDSQLGMIIKHSLRNTIEKCSINNATTRALVISESSNNLIKGCSLQNIRDIAVEINSSASNTLDSNQISSCNMALSIFNSKANKLVGNVLKSVDLGMYLEASFKEGFNNTIDSSNTIDGKPIGYLYGQTNNQVVGKDLSHLTLAYCKNITVRKNTITNDAIFLFSSNGCKILDNNISRIYGMRLMDSSHNEISGNEFLGNRFSGLYLVSSPWNKITGNIASRNNQNGVALVNSSSNDVHGNDLGKNREAGLWLNVSNDNRIYQNNLTANPIGLRLMNSDGNAIYRNNFIDNKEQAEDSNGSNSWDMGNVTGGNYWSDYKVLGNPSSGKVKLIKGLKTDNHPFQDQNGWLKA